MRFVHLQVLVLCLKLSLAAYPAHAAEADGDWSVRIVVEAGPCFRPPGFRYFVNIENEVVSKANPTDRATSLVGRVDQTGSVRFTAVRGDERAVGTGILSDGIGSGTWHLTSAKRECSGSWTAKKR